MLVGGGLHSGIGATRNRGRDSHEPLGILPLSVLAAWIFVNTRARVQVAPALS